MYEAYIISEFLLMIFTAQGFGQENYHMDFSATGWEENKDGYVCLHLPKTNEASVLPAEFKKLKFFSIFNVPFQIEPVSVGKFATSTKGTEQISISTPAGTQTFFRLSLK